MEDINYDPVKIPEDSIKIIKDYYIPLGFNVVIPTRRKQMKTAKTDYYHSIEGLVPTYIIDWSPCDWQTGVFDGFVIKATVRNMNVTVFDYKEVDHETLMFKSWDDFDFKPFINAVRSSYNTFHKWIPWCTENFGKKGATRWIKGSIHEYHRKVRHGFAVYKGTNLVGSIEVRVQRDNTGIVGYWITEAFQNQGIGTSMLSKMIDFCKELGLESLLFEIGKDNIPSQKLLMKFDPVWLGYHMQSLQVGDKMIDQSLFRVILHENIDDQST